MEIDEQLAACGWVVQDYKHAAVAAAQGVAVREVPISPIEKRGQIVSRLEEEFQQAAVLEQAAGSALDRVTALRRSILAAAFSGQLVPQDPTDEPASVLLECIAASQRTAPTR